MDDCDETGDGGDGDGGEVVRFIRKGESIVKKGRRGSGMTTTKSEKAMNENREGWKAHSKQHRNSSCDWLAVAHCWTPGVAAADWLEGASFIVGWAMHCCAASLSAFP